MKRCRGGCLLANAFGVSAAEGREVAVQMGLRNGKVRFGEAPLQRTRSDGQAFKPAREARALPRQRCGRHGRHYSPLNSRSALWSSRLTIGETGIVLKEAKLGQGEGEKS